MPPAAAGAEPSGRVLDLMAALEESVAKVKASRAEDDGDADVHELSKNSAARKMAVKKDRREVSTVKK
ncbi:hypothetical protein OG548_45860 [Streptomyces sp. NBC_01356]|uniref:hypothetical protein n=1 Tax=Streptomyces sp. NBC_01356 TaxID=2903836 RepID=UPI002E3008B4|nr:hypothetical protein [Streptomyces sp. NBC_01356]